MAFTDLFTSGRRRRDGVREVYRYEEIPESLRAQILRLLDQALGDARQFHDKRGPRGPRQAYAIIVETLCKDYGLPVLVGPPARGARDHRSELWEFLLAEKDIDRVLDAVELSFRCIDYVTRSYDYLERPKADVIASAAIADLNACFREHRVGYLYRGGEIVRVI
jgi:hypothetical protein